MNETLKSIAKQAQVEHCVSHVRLEEFANLILFECIKIAVFKGDKDTGKAIKDHFGVDRE
jgi:hypothetical protein